MARLRDCACAAPPNLAKGTLASAALPCRRCRREMLKTLDPPVHFRKLRDAKCSADYVGFPVPRHQSRLRNLAANRPVSRGVDAPHGPKSGYGFRIESCPKSNGRESPGRQSKFALMLRPLTLGGGLRQRHRAVGERLQVVRSRRRARCRAAGRRSSWWFRARTPSGSEVGVQVLERPLAALAPSSGRVVEARMPSPCRARSRHRGSGRPCWPRPSRRYGRRRTSWRRWRPSRRRRWRAVLRAAWPVRPGPFAASVGASGTAMSKPGFASFGGVKIAPAAMFMTSRNRHVPSSAPRILLSSKESIFSSSPQAEKEF